MVCHQAQDHLQCQILDLIKRESRPDVLKQRFISTNVIHHLVQNHSQDLHQGQGHTVKERSKKTKEDQRNIDIHHIQALIQICRWIDILQDMQILEDTQKLCVLIERQIGYLSKRNLTVTEKL